ncbi:PAS domain-containing sensor histidine kinase [Flavobacterium sp. NRK1]|uniref:PAS domain-containing sensor histidine kinase n=1 Tax=Flavobacterium sp. NRK1 TaxID=2954929 RepID=UPI002092574E|nr:PAS domain-containing sensor histidine kinase [Flavobacterium sp. NRK1]MCO6148478.1 PAS domain-containing sensor histidine kinase [Flavobacterium sp. NRK1]
MKIFDNPDLHDGESLNAFYKKLLDQVPDLIFKIRWDNKTEKYSIVFINESINDLYEVPHDLFRVDPRRVFYERMVQDDIEPFIKSLQASRKNLTKWDHSYRLQLPEKGLRWMRITAKPELTPDGSVSFYGRAIDITDHKQQEEKLHISEERYHYALKAASEGIWDWDLKTNIVYFSAQLMKILGKREVPGYFPNTFWLSRIHPDDIEAYNKSKWDYFKRKQTSYESIYRILTDQGKYRWVLSRGSAVSFDENNKPTRAIGTLKDINQLKEKEVELGNTINIIVSQNNRLNNFAHIVSHNLRSHASNLKMLLDLFKTANEEERQEMMEHLEAISDGLSITIGHLKELVEIQTEIKNVKEELNLRHYLKNILNILHNEIKKHGVDIEINIPLDVTVSYNPAYLESILLNFTTNAIKYSNPERKPMISYDFEIINGKKALSITDNGLGIDLKKHKNSLFGMYKTFHKNQNARGIGLFITKNQVEAMGGKIEVSSELNKGTTFKIYFNEED